MGRFRTNRIEIPPPGESDAREAAGTAAPVASAPASPASFLRETEVRTSIGPDAIISGRLSFTTSTRIEGKLKGEVRCTSLLVVGESAVVEGVVRADELHINGLVQGDVIETRRVKIGPTGRLLGRLQAQSVIVCEGGSFDGQVRMSTGEDRDRTAISG